MTVYRYESVKVPAQRRVTCPVCKKRRTIRRTFQQTVNPFHPAIRSLAAEVGPVSGYDAHQVVWRSTREAAEAWDPGDVESMHGACLEEWRKGGVR